MSETKFSVDYSKRLSKCKKCKLEIAKGNIRLAKNVQNFFGGEDSDKDMKQYYHIKCLFETFKRAKATTRKIESADDIEDFKSIKEDDKKDILKLIDARNGETSSKTSAATSSKNIDSKAKTGNIKKNVQNDSSSSSDSDSGSDDDDDKKNKNSKASLDDSNDNLKSKHADCDDNKFETFQKIVDQIANESGHLKKTEILKNFFKNGINGKGYKGDTYTFCKLILPQINNRVFNFQSKQLVKLFSRVFSVDLDEMNDHLNKGDVSLTVRHYFSKSNGVKPSDNSTLNIFQVDSFLDKLTEITKEQDQQKLLESISKKCTKNDLKTFIRLIKKDLRIDSGTKIILDSINSQAYAAFQVSRDLKDVINRSSDLDKLNASSPNKLKKDLSIKINLLTPVKPMLADACKSVEQAFNKCKNGIYAEVKYDGERLQVHKNASTFKYYSRNLKAVQEHKTAYLKEFLPKSFPQASSLILDGEILLYDTKTKKPLPFGTLGVHKKNAFKDASVCFYVFDCVFLNGKDLMKTPMLERRKILEDNITEIPGRIMLSELTLITKPVDLRKLMMSAINQGLEGLVLKDTKSIYEPGKRHWLKMKKDYLDSGSMADTADLVVLGAYYGTGNKGGMKSIFLMGVLNAKNNTWHTVTKVGNGFDDKTLDKLQKSIDMVEIKKNSSKVPSWLQVDSTLLPDFVVRDPKKSPVWEITGAEFSESKTHTADGIYIRFPRVTKVRDDKSWKEATDLDRLKVLFKLSKEKSDVIDEDDDDKDIAKKSSPKKNLKRSSDSDTDVNLKKKKLDITTNSIDSTKQRTAFLDMFKDKTFFISNKVEKMQEIKRYIIAYDGAIVDEKAIKDATHIVISCKTESSIQGSENLTKITEKGFWSCVRNKKFSVELD
jgi:DNA ligase-3